MMKPSSEQIARDLARFKRHGGCIEKLPPGAHTEPVFKADKAQPTQYQAARARGRATQSRRRLASPLPPASMRSLPSGASASTALFFGEEE